MSERSTGGYSINIKKVKMKGDLLTVYVTEKEPLEGEIVTESVTYPIVQMNLNTLLFLRDILNYEMRGKLSRI